MDSVASPKLTAMLCRHEGFKKYAYTDTIGFVTIGCGRNIDRNGGLGLSDDEIYYLLNNDILRVIRELSSYEWFVTLDEVRRDACIDFSFNVGATTVKEFKMFRACMQLGDWELAARELLDSRYARQVGDRAVELSEMIRTGQYR